jgi:hypothetical protein
LPIFKQASKSFKAYRLPYREGSSGSGFLHPGHVLKETPMALHIYEFADETPQQHFAEHIEGNTTMSSFITL